MNSDQRACYRGMIATINWTPGSTAASASSGSATTLTGGPPPPPTPLPPGPGPGISQAGLTNAESNYQVYVLLVEGDHIERRRVGAIDSADADVGKITAELTPGQGAIFLRSSTYDVIHAAGHLGRLYGSQVTVNWDTRTVTIPLIPNGTSVSESIWTQPGREINPGTARDRERVQWALLRQTEPK